MIFLKFIRVSSIFFFVITFIASLLVYRSCDILVNQDIFLSDDMLTRSIPTSREYDQLKLISNRNLDQLIKNINNQTDTSNKLNTLKQIEKEVSEWFVHGQSNYRPCENWSLYLLSKLPFFNKKAVMGVLDPNDIIKSHYAFCSQSALVLQAVLEHFNYEFASVGFDSINGGHLASAALVDGAWYYLDSNIENTRNVFPVKVDDIASTKNNLLIMERYLDHPNIYKLITESNKMGNTRLMDINKYPATMGALLHVITKIFSDFGWALFISIYFISSYCLNRLKKSNY